MTSNRGWAGVGDAGSLVGVVGDAARELAGLAAPGHGGPALEQAEALIAARGFVDLALERRIAVVQRTGAAKAAGHATVPAWLRSKSGGRMGKAAAGVSRRNAIQFQRLPRVVAALLAGQISHDMATAIAAAVSCLGKDVDVSDTEDILLRLALEEPTTPEKVAFVGRHLRQVLDPDGSLSDEDKAYGDRYLATMTDDKGGMTGRFYLPPEAAAKLQQVLDEYANQRHSADDRTKSQRYADAFIALLNQKVTTQILVLVNSETLPDDHPTNPASADTGSSQPGTRQDGGQSQTGQRGTGPAASTDAAGDTDAAGEAGTDHNRPTGGAAEPTSDNNSAATPDDVERDGNWGTEDWTGDWIGDGTGDATGRWDELDEQAREQVQIALAHWLPNGGHQPDPLPCDTCGRPANRNTPGLLMPTGHPLPAKHVHRLLHTSQMFRVVVNARARVIDTSYAVRFVPDWMRRLVLLQYPTCSYDNCPIEAQYCDMDHVFDWAKFNRTRADEVIPACGHHNRDRARNPHKYRLEKLPDQRWHFTTTKHQT